MYKESKYHILFKDDISGKYLLYNFNKEILIPLNLSQYDIVKKILKNPNDNVDNDYFKVLFNKGFILNVFIDELTILKEESRECLLSEPVYIAISPTLNCNFSCYYCYQERLNSYMSKEMADTIINKINSYEKNIVFNWIGGEPLLNFDIIKYISQRTIVSFESNLYTNGYLLDKYIAELDVLNLKMIYLTIDGNPIKHNSIRFLNNDKNSFDKIMNNIYLISEKYPNIKIVVKTNIEQEDSFDFKDFISYFDDLKGKIRINPGCVIKRDKDGNSSFIDYSNIYYEDLLKNDFAVYKLPAKNAIGCPAYNKDSFSISSTGTIHKCIECIGTEDLIIGSINDDNMWNMDLEKIEEINKFDIFNKIGCVNCKLFPYCMGGCLKYQLKNNSNMKKCKTFSQRLFLTKSMISNFYNKMIVE